MKGRLQVRKREACFVWICEFFRFVGAVPANRYWRSVFVLIVTRVFMVLSFFMIVCFIQAD
jgi:uncharacterized membrane protein